MTNAQTREVSRYKNKGYSYLGTTNDGVLLCNNDALVVVNAQGENIYSPDMHEFIVINDVGAPNE